MAYKILYFDEALDNVKESKKWYKEQKNGLQNVFASSIKSAIIRVQANPLVFAVRYRNIRIAHPYKFPFSIHFYIDEPRKLIVITNIIHDQRDIETKQ
jgi:hypothetical protein